MLVSEGFSARYYEKGQPQSRDVEVQFASSKVVVCHAGECLQELDYSRALISLAGQDGLRVKIEPPGSAWAVIFNDETILPKLLAFTRSSALGKQIEELIARAEKRKGHDRRYWTTVIGTISVFCLVFYFSFALMVDMAVSRVDPEFESKIGDFLAKLHEAENKEVPQKERVERIGKRLLTALGKTPYRFRFFYDDSEEINAFAYPGGVVVVNEGLLKTAESDDEVAGVVGHEIGHVIHRDTLKAAVRNMGVGAIFMILFGGAGDDKRVLALLNMAKLGESLEGLRFGRDQEAKADTFGVDLTIKAGYDPHGLVKFFQKLDSKTEEEHTKIPDALSILSTHPMTKDRIAAINAEIERVQKK
ncbi:MAG: M48 family metalloprotease [Candidatus Obscuribacterales bacterium]|nr:M48 family metalloprotease [Candidatus Obscuribacterales bacterium]